jgi:hypothetical protein
MLWRQWRAMAVGRDVATQGQRQRLFLLHHPGKRRRECEKLPGVFMRVWGERRKVLAEVDGRRVV